MSLSGQWTIPYNGNNAGTLVIDVDEVGDHYEGTACAWDSMSNSPGSLVRFRTLSKADAQHLSDVPVVPIDTSGFVPPAGIEKLKANNVPFPETANIDVDLKGDSLLINWKTNIGSSGTVEIPRTCAGKLSELQPLPVETWDAFKKHVNKLDSKRYIFRGHESNEWRLRTSFHRTGRANLERYFLHDINDLQKQLSSLTTHLFDLTNNLQFGAFINLAQHHGYPTPLLDWTWSPYVAAFFAYRKLSINKTINGGEKIRIYKFDIVQWNKVPQLNRLFPAMPHISILDALAINNSRVIPQQSISTISNIDDMESHVRKVESIQDRNYLEVIDLQASERRHIMQELALMGITAGSMFPGLDGACESLRERNF